MASVTLEKVWKIYNSGQSNAVEAVKNASLFIPDGEFVALLGPSGCGKTSILRMIAGLEYISRGSILIGDQVVNNLTPAQRNVAMAFETYALYPHFNVYENLVFCLKAKGVEKSEIEKRVNSIISALHLESIVNKRPSELPGGQQQMVSVARAMVRDPNVFLLDEIFSHIDASMRVEARAAIKMLVNRTKTTAILVTHDQHEAIAMADRVVVMNFAEIQQYGTAHELIHEPANLFVANFVGEPGINLFRCSVEEKDGAFYLGDNEKRVRIPIGNRVRSLVEEAGAEDVVVGIRPQELKLTSPEKAFMKGEVALFEFLGEESHLMVKIGETQVTAVTEPHLHVTIDETVALEAPASEILIFDPKTEMAICHGVG